MENIIQNSTIGGVREPLAEKLPLKAPYLLQIFPIYGCNFKCEYCIYSLPHKQHGYISKQTFMKMSLYKKIIDDIVDRDEKVKMLRFAAIGEPLLHKEIAEMVHYANKVQVAESIDIVTNGSLLTRELADKLVSVGLSRLRISLEGLCDEDYKKHASADIDFQQMVENIRYLYENCGQTHIYIKIIDYMIQDKDKEKKFFETFQQICHSIAIEHLTPTIKEIDYDIVSGGMEMDKPQNGERMLVSQICPQPFYMMQINPDGNVVPCCSMKYPTVLGDVHKDNLLDIWNGEAYNRFRRDMLHSVKQAGKVCEDCTLYLYDMHPEDKLDVYSEKLLSKYGEKKYGRSETKL